jgi:riboflavin kinase/FMN adenylyltransferase
MIHLTNKNIKITQPTAVSIGKFDGIHRGHMALINEQKKVAAAKGLATLVLTFTPHPMSFFAGEPLPLILTPNEKKELFASLGIDYYLEYAFDNAFAQTPPEDFLRNILYGQLQGRVMVVAEDYRFGSKGAGDVPLARKIGAELGFEVRAIPHVIHDGHKISSEYLRRLVTKKKFQLIEELCGRHYFIKGRPVTQVHEEKILPPNGTYNTITSIDGKDYKSITHIEAPTIKTQISGIDKNVQNEIITVRFM